MHQSIDQARQHEGQQDHTDRTMQMIEHVLRRPNVDVGHDNPDGQREQNQRCHYPMKQASGD